MQDFSHHQHFLGDLVVLRKLFRLSRARHVSERWRSRAKEERLTADVRWMFAPNIVHKKNLGFWRKSEFVASQHGKQRQSKYIGISTSYGTMIIMYYIIKQSMHYVSHVYHHFSESPISWCNNTSLCNPIYHLLWVHHQRNAKLLLGEFMAC